MPASRIRWKKLAVAVAAAGALVAITPADASFPGRNGKIAISDSWGTLYFVSEDGKAVKPLLNRQGRTVLDVGRGVTSFSFAPGGRKIAYSCYSRFRSQAHAICLVNVDGTHRRVITRPPISGTDPGDTYPVWSPDGERIVFQRRAANNGYIYVVNADGRGLVRVETGSACVSASTGRNVSAPDWSPAGAIAFFCATTTPAGQTSGSGLFVTRDPRQPARRVDCMEASRPYFGWSAPPAFSPDGSRIAFGDDHQEIVSIAADAVAARPCDEQVLLNKHVARVIWAPDGKKIAFVDNPGNGFALFVADLGQPDSARPVYRFSSPRFVDPDDLAWLCVGSCRLR